MITPVFPIKNEVTHMNKFFSMSHDLWNSVESVNCLQLTPSLNWVIFLDILIFWDYLISLILLD